MCGYRHTECAVYYSCDIIDSPVLKPSRFQKTEVLTPIEDDVVQQRNPDDGTCGLELLGDLHVRCGWFLLLAMVSPRPPWRRTQCRRINSCRLSLRERAFFRGAKDDSCVCAGPYRVFSPRRGQTNQPRATPWVPLDEGLFRPFRAEVLDTPRTQGGATRLTPLRSAQGCYVAAPSGRKLVYNDEAVALGCHVTPLWGKIKHHSNTRSGK